MTAERHVLVVANETVAGRSLIEAIERRRKRRAGARHGDHAREPAARGLRRLRGHAPRGSGPAARAHAQGAPRGRDSGSGLVVETDPVDATRDALAQLEPRPDEIVVSTHPEQRSGWLRRNVIDRIKSAAGGLPVEHVVVDLEREDGGDANVLVVANETVVGEPLLDKIRERAQQGRASLPDRLPAERPGAAAHPEAERRLRRALTILRGEGIDAHGQVAHPDPYTAAMQAVQDERIDEIIVSTFPGEKTSSWLRGDLINRLRKATGLPVEHVVVEREPDAEAEAVT